jgi:hypothetical protein
MANPQRNEAWLIDLGLAGKIRPAVVISVPAQIVLSQLSCLTRPPRADPGLK